MSEKSAQQLWREKWQRENAKNGTAPAGNETEAIQTKAKGHEENNQQHSNGGGPAQAPEPQHEMGETYRGQIQHWEVRIVQMARELLKADPEYHKVGLTLEDVAPPLRNEIDAAVTSSLFNTQFAVYKPPEWMSNLERYDSIDRAVAVAWDWFLEKDRNGLILSTLPAKPLEPEIVLPDLTKKTIEPLNWRQMRERRAAKTREWIVSGKLARGETSSWSGKVEAGKTTLMRELTLCVLRGESFLGCDTQRGRVAYVMLDADGEDVTFDAFQEMGFCEDDADNCLFLFEPTLAQIERGFEKFIKILMDFNPTLVIVDPYPRLKMIEDFHSYTNTYLMAELSQVAQMVNAHFALPGHVPRGRDDDADVATAGFGSISFSGGVNARFIVTNRNGKHTIRSSQGKGAGFQPFEGEQSLIQDEFTKRISLGGAWSWKDKARSYMPQVLEFLDDHQDRPFSVVTLAKELRLQKSVVRAAANMLFNDQKINRGGEGIRSDPYIFASFGYSGEMTQDAAKYAEM